MLARIDATPDPLYTIAELHAFAALEYEQRLMDRAGWNAETGEMAPDAPADAREALTAFWHRRREMEKERESE